MKLPSVQKPTKPFLAPGDLDASSVSGAEKNGRERPAPGAPPAAPPKEPALVEIYHKPWIP